VQEHGHPASITISRSEYSSGLSIILEGKGGEVENEIGPLGVMAFSRITHELTGSAPGLKYVQYVCVGLGPSWWAIVVGLVYSNSPSIFISFFVPSIANKKYGVRVLSEVMVNRCRVSLTFMKDGFGTATYRTLFTSTRLPH
jgi:hypothetical protein